MSLEDDEEQEQSVDLIAQHMRNYRLTFGSQWGQSVLVDLAQFCRAAETCVAVPSKMAAIDLNRTLVLEGRREVFLRIQRNLSLTPDQMFKLSTGLRIGELT